MQSLGQTSNQSRSLGCPCPLVELKYHLTIGGIKRAGLFIQSLWNRGEEGGLKQMVFGKEAEIYCLSLGRRIFVLNAEKYFILLRPRRVLPL